MILFNLCNDSGILMVFLIIKYTIKIICTIVPLILIYRSIVPFFKTITTGEPITKELKSLTGSFVAGFIVFLIPSLFNFIFTALIPTDSTMLTACFNKATIENINSLKLQEEQNRKNEVKNNKDSYEDSAKKQAEEQEKLNEEIKKRREEQEKQEQQNANNSNNNSNNNSGGGQNSNTYGDLFVGDSRTAGYSYQLSLNSTDSIYATSGGALSAFNSDVSKAIAKINSDPNHRYNLVLNYGANNLSQDWVGAYKNVINQLDGKANILIVSVNPCNDNIAKYCRNANVFNFNNKLKAAFSTGYSNVKYCDTYTPFINTPNYISMIETNEGIHYTKEGSQLIYNQIQQCLKNF